MPVSAQDIITGALVDIGEVGVGEVAGTDDLNYGLIRLNGIVDTWSTERLSLYTDTRAQFQLVAGQQDYDLGPTAAAFIAPRPVLIQTASIILNGTSIRFLMNMLTAKQWAMIPEKSLTGILPTDFYQDGDFPNVGLHVAPIPNANIQMELYYWAALTQFASLAALLSMPPGYLDALKYTLMLHLSPAYNKPIDPSILALAQSKKAAIQSLNAQILSGSFGESRTLHGPNIGAAVTPPVLTPGGQGGEPGPVNF